MKDANRLLDDIRIASPCTASWDAMTGNDTVRFCGECKLNVYNLSDMTAAEAATLVERAEGRLCVRLYKRKDGTVLTRNCPVGLRATLARASRAAGAALAMVLGLFSGVAARASSRFATAPQDRTAARPFPGQESQEPVLMGKIAAPRHWVSISITDQMHHMPVTNARVILSDPRTGDTWEAEQSEDGRYVFSNTRPGVFTLTISADGYESSKPRRVRIRAGQPLNLDLTLVNPHAVMGMVAWPEKSGEREAVESEEGGVQTLSNVPRNN
jgi:hypothetical protein